MTINNIENLWNTLYSTFNKALHCHVNVKVLDKIDDKPILPWPSFSKEEFRLALSKYNNLSAPSSDKLSWDHLKCILKEDKCLNVTISIANTCIEVGYWPLHFKKSTSHHS